MASCVLRPAVSILVASKWISKSRILTSSACICDIFEALSAIILSNSTEAVSICDCKFSTF